MIKCIICDIDNVFVDSREWNKFLPTGNNREEWDSYQSKCLELCKPNPEIIEHITSLARVTPIIFLTGREGTKILREATLRQIFDYSNGRISIGGNNKLIMRAPEDYRDAYIVKEEQLEKLMKEYTPFLAIDDDIDNVKMFDKHGILTIHYKKFN